MSVSSSKPATDKSSSKPTTDQFNPYELCAGAKHAYVRYDLIFTHLYLANGVYLLSILYGDAIYYLELYVADTDVIKAFAYPVAITLFLLLILVSYIFYKRSQSRWVSLLLCLLSSLADIVIANLIYEGIESWYPAGSSKHLQVTWILTTGLTILFMSGWLLCKTHQHERVAQIQINYILHHLSKKQARYKDEPIPPQYTRNRLPSDIEIDQIHINIDEYSQQHSSKQHVETIFTLPLIDRESLLYELQDILNEPYRYEYT